MKHHPAAASAAVPEDARALVGSYEALRANPGLCGVLFDQEDGPDNHVLGELGMGDRWELVAGDFFEAAPSGEDLYALKVHPARLG